jgi:hypothetical protein
MGQAWVVSVDGQVTRVESPRDLDAVLSAGARPPQEIWLTSPRGASMCLLRSGDRALLMYLRTAGDTGFTSRSDTPTAGPPTTRFGLANGQVDEYPSAWTVSTSRAIEALEYFLRTEDRPPFIAWNDDGAG